MHEVSEIHRETCSTCPSIMKSSSPQFMTHHTVGQVAAGIYEAYGLASSPPLQRAEALR